MEIKHLFFRENQYRLTAISDFYKKICDYTKFASECDDDNMRKTQQYLAFNSAKIDKIFYESGIKPSMWYWSHAMWYIERSITLDIPFFTKEALNSEDWWSISANVLGDIENYYQRTIWIYSNNKTRSLLNIVNPFEYIRRISKLLVSPIVQIFNTNYDNKVIKTVQWIIKLIIDWWAMWQIIQYLWYDQYIVNFIRLFQK